jgi:hypothetical protein
VGWAARGWFAGAERWLGEAMAAIGRPLTGPVEQAQVWDLSCVLRAPTAAGAVWFKSAAASPLFVNEGVVMAELAGLFPDRLAAPLAALHHAVSYRSIVAGMTPPVEPHMSRSTAWWLRQVLAGLS